MSFLHPEFLWLAPLIALPVLIHLLNRLRYRRVRWAAIEFLLTTERRAVRRARLRQILLMLLRMALLAAALTALAQPIVRGGLAALLGGSSQVAVVLDASASMAASGAGGAAFERGKRLVADTLKALPRTARAAGGAFARRYESPFREPLLDRDAVVSVLDNAPLTGGRGDVPRALRDAAAALARGGGDGSIWLLTDLQASGWRADDVGEWEQVRDALEKAGRPRLLITDLSPGAASNLTVNTVQVSPAVLVEGDEPKLTATVTYRGQGGALATVGLFLDGRRIDTRSHEFDEPGKADVVFRLPALSAGAHAGRVELSPDAMPGDDRHHFVLRTAAQLPVLVVDGAPSSVAFDGAGDFVALALEPPESSAAARSDLTVKIVPVGQFAGTGLTGYAAVILCDLPPVSEEVSQALREYTEAGGLLIVFPGRHTDLTVWNAAKVPCVPIQSIVEPEGSRRIKLGPVSQTSPVVSTLPAEGLDRVLVQRLFRFETEGQTGEILIQTERGEPFLVRRQVGKGKAYVFAVSAQGDCSNLPFTPPFLLVLHRAIDSHLVEAAAPLSLPVYTELRLALGPGMHQLVLPDGKAVPVMRPPEGELLFDRTGQAGVYRLAAGDTPPEDPRTAAPIAALNVPAAESELERIEPATVHALVPGISVSFLLGDGRAESLGGGGAKRTAASSFPLAALAMAFLVGAVVLAWSMGRTASAGREEAKAAIGETPQPPAEARVGASRSAAGV